ncbi:MAG: hypothetical protein ABJA82_08650 [Myxococcales bacterium]
MHLAAPDREKVVKGLLETTGAESVVRRFDVGTSIRAGQARFRYIPNVRAGSLNFSFAVLDASDSIIAIGKGGPVTLTTGAVAVTIVLDPGVAQVGKKGDGVPCATAGECSSGFCADGLCCDESCGGACESCALANSLGLCTGYEANTDPELECAGGGDARGSVTEGDGGVGSGDAGLGSDATINPPDGGIISMPAVCAGICNGARACDFPRAGLGCGTTFCNTRKDVASFTCNGKGGCQLSLSSCVDYGCNFATAECRTQCAAHAECLPVDYCNGQNMCVKKKKDSLTCTTDAECASGHCADGVCCNTACDAPATCNVSGSAGKCTCPGVTCPAGVACQIYYQDAEVDGYGNRSGTLAAGTAKAACAGAPPAGFVADNSDCDDADANVHPGQNAYFATSSKGVGAFDYDCSGAVEKESREYPGASCKFCGPVAMCNQVAATCSTVSQQSYLVCALGTVICGQAATTTKTCSACGRDILGARDVGFTATVPCGATAPFTTCGTCTVAKGTASPTVANKAQRCH